VLRLRLDMGVYVHCEFKLAPVPKSFDFEIVKEENALLEDSASELEDCK
jgi:hypothetical protein